MLCWEIHFGFGGIYELVGLFSQICAARMNQRLCSWLNRGWPRLGLPAEAQLVSNSYNRAAAFSSCGSCCAIRASALAPSLSTLALSLNLKTPEVGLHYRPRESLQGWKGSVHLVVPSKRLSWLTRPHWIFWCMSQHPELHLVSGCQVWLFNLLHCDFWKFRDSRGLVALLTVCLQPAV